MDLTVDQILYRLHQTSRVWPRGRWTASGTLSKRLKIVSHKAALGVLCLREGQFYPFLDTESLKAVCCTLSAAFVANLQRQPCRPLEPYRIVDLFLFGLGASLQGC